jgi:hypothetical protein
MANNFLSNFFGTNQNNQLGRFINQVSGRLPIANQIWGKKEAVWVDTNNAWRLFIEIPELRSVIDKRASMMSSNHPCLYDMNGDRVESHWLLDLFKDPNAMQSWSEWSTHYQFKMLCTLMHSHIVPRDRLTLET